MNESLNNQIIELINFAINTIKNNDRWVEIGNISQKNINDVKELFSIDLTGFIRIIDVSGIKHTIKQHGNEQRESLRGQQAIETTDFLLIPYIVENYDELKLGKNERGLNAIIYIKKIDSIYYYVEEIRIGRKKVSLNTMYKKSL